MEITKTIEQPASSTGEEKTSDEKQVKQYVPLESVNSADTATAKSRDSVLESASNVKEDAADVLATNEKKVDITAVDKLEFIKAVTTGSRYTSTMYLFGGNLKVKFRSRSVEETEAILSYMHKTGMSGKFVTRADVSNTSLAALLVAQVAELGDVEYAEMKAPLKYVEDADGIHEPGWLQDLDVWKKKPEMLVAALGDALVEFEAKYWAMIGASKNENFWNPGGYTGK